MTDRRFILTIDLIRHNKRLPTITNKIEQLSIISNFFLLNIHLIQGKIVLFFSGPFILNDSETVLRQWGPHCVFLMGNPIDINFNCLS